MKSKHINYAIFFVVGLLVAMMIHFYIVDREFQKHKDNFYIHNKLFYGSVERR
jgi:hypothetical protein